MKLSGSVGNGTALHFGDVPDYSFGLSHNMWVNEKVCALSVLFQFLNLLNSLIVLSSQHYCQTEDTRRVLPCVPCPHSGHFTNSR